MECILKICLGRHTVFTFLKGIKKHFSLVLAIIRRLYIFLYMCKGIPYTYDIQTYNRNPRIMYRYNIYMCL